MRWNADAKIATLQSRSRLLTKIRQFFTQHNYLEVETPLLGKHTVTDPHIDSFSAQGKAQQPPQYLQTSPEFFMKRLLAHGSGPIYQICKAFRQEEQGKQHNPEFTILEFYQPGFDHHALMQQVDHLMRYAINTPPAEKVSYLELFQSHLRIDPHTASLNELHEKIKQQNIQISTDALDRDACLQLLLSHSIEPNIGKQQPLFIYDYPTSQAALAKIRTGSPAVAERFELYYKGMELANGFHELNDSKQQQHRFELDLKQRAIHQKALPSLDNKFIECLDKLPACSGVAIGVDRLAMLHAKADRIEQVLTFSWDER